MGDISRRSSTQQLSRESGTFMASDERGQGSWNRNPRWGERRSPDEGSFQSTGAGAWAEVRLTSPDSRQLCVWGRSAQAEGGSHALQDARRLSARLCVEHCRSSWGDQDQNVVSEAARATEAEPVHTASGSRRLSSRATGPGRGSPAHRRCLGMCAPAQPQGLPTISQSWHPKCPQAAVLLSHAWELVRFLTRSLPQV